MTSLAQRIIASKTPFVFLHTHTVTKELLRHAIAEEKSMDLDVCVGDAGSPYLGHSREYHEKSREPWFDSMPLWEAVDMIAGAAIPIIVDCKHFDAWPVVEEVITRIGPARCLVHTFVAELRFDFRDGSPDFTTEWSPIRRLDRLKDKFPSVTTCASAKWLPDDLLTSDKHEELLHYIRQILKDNRVDTVCLNVPGGTFSDKPLRYFLKEAIIPHVEIDGLDTTHLTELYIGETDHLSQASNRGHL